MKIKNVFVKTIDGYPGDVRRNFEKWKSDISDNAELISIEIKTKQVDDYAWTYITVVYHDGE